ncbi:MAG: hypothetical protein HC806_10705 [Anaerolineae bacterium]|nr:hypothetical protein [Anaerolineae bacterium]
MMPSPALIIPSIINFKRFHRILLIFPLAISLLGCGLAPAIGQNTDSIPGEPMAPPSLELTATSLPVLTPEGNIPTMTPTFSTSPDSNLQKLIERAQEDLAQRLSVSVTQINLVEATEVIWPDSSLGCPNPATSQLQVLTPGYLIRLHASDRIFEYHTNKNNLVIYCDNPSLLPSESLPDK